MSKNQRVQENYVPLGDIVEDLSSYLKKFSLFKKYEKDIKKKYKKYNKTTTVPDHWPVEFIKRALKKTETMRTTSERRKGWSLVILLEVMKRSQGYDESEREEAQSDVKEDNQQSGGDLSADKPVYVRIPFSEMSDNNDTVKKKSLKSTKKENQYKLIDKVPSPTQILQKYSYITLYDNQTRNAAWVYELLNKNPTAIQVKKTNGKFKPDPSVHPLFQPDTATYKDTGYNRGHLAAAANHKWCQETYEDTYFISNVVPQQSNFNSGLWSYLEELCRVIVQQISVRNVHVYTGPLYLSSDRKSKDNNDQDKIEKHVEYEIMGGKAVPTHLFKVIIVENIDGEVLEPECYKMANETERPKRTEKVLDSKDFSGMPPQIVIKEKIKKLREYMNSYNVTLEEIQRDSGLIFEENEIEEEMVDETCKVQWRKNPDKEGRGALIRTRVSCSYTDHRARVH